MLHIYLKTKLKTPMVEYGQLTFLKSGSDPEVSIIYTTFSLDIIMRLLMELTFPKVNISTLILIT